MEIDADPPNWACNISSIEATVDTAFSQQNMDILISNAGMCHLESKVINGMDVNMATNYYGHVA